MTQQEYYLGDIIGYKSAFTSGDVYAYFAGAAKKPEGWEVTIAFSPVVGGVGGNSFLAKPLVHGGDVIRLARNFQLYIDKDGNPRKSRTITCSELRISAIEQDCLKIDIAD